MKQAIKLLALSCVLFCCFCQKPENEGGTPIKNTGSGSETVKITAAVTVNPSEEHQNIDGFGAMNSWGDYGYWTDAECDLMFKELKLSIMRIRISPDENNWGNLLECCRYATGTYGVRILATPWTMPASMKDTGSLNASDNGTLSHLKETSYEDYAKWLEKFAKYMKDNGAPLYAISVQNEPDWPAPYEGCNWTGEQILNFVKNYGGLITSAKLVSGESMSMNRAYYDGILNDKTACDNIDIIAGHLYGVPAPQSYGLAEEKGKPVWMTEHLLNDSWTKNTSHWDETMKMADEMSDCMNAGWNAYIWWYGRRYYSLIGDGEEGSAKGAILQRGQAFGQFSRYIQAGDKRVGSSVEGTSQVRVCAFKNKSGLAVIIINDAESKVNVTVNFNSAEAGTAATTTSSSEVHIKLDVTAGTDRKSAAMTLPATSVTSLQINL